MLLIRMLANEFIGHLITNNHKGFAATEEAPTTIV